MPRMFLYPIMNNMHYIGQKVRGSDLRTLIGDDWLRKHSETKYLRSLLLRQIGYVPVRLIRRQPKGLTQITWAAASEF
jgi:hypothetical protein